MPATATAPLCTAPDPAPRPPTHTVPSGACDTHMHICGPESHHPYVPERIYTPPDALLGDYLVLTDRLRLERVVFVQPSIYGADNAAMLEAMACCPLISRGVAVADDGIDRDTLRDWHSAGVRGLRLNLVDTRQARAEIPSATLHRLASLIAELGWHIELLMHVDDFPALDRTLADLPVDIVVGHLGYMRRGVGVEHPGFAALLRLIARGRCWVKLTGPYRLTDERWPYAAVAPCARTLIAEAPERLVWGSDWPHVMLRGAMPNDGDLLDLLFDWAESPQIAQRILVDNAAVLYGF